MVPNSKKSLGGVVLNVFMVLAPTKPLINQHANTFSEFFEPKEKTVVLSGEINPDKRKKIWENSNIIISTPQTIKFDLISGKINLKDVKLLVVDEAHKSILMGMMFGVQA